MLRKSTREATSSSKKLSLPRHIRRTRRVSAGASVCPPSLVLWESGIDANGSSSSRSNSKKSTNSAEEVIDSSDICSACNVSLKGGLSSRTKSPDLTYRGDGPGTGTGIGFQPRPRVSWLLFNTQTNFGTNFPAPVRDEQSWRLSVDLKFD